MTALLNWRVWAAIVIAVFLAGTHWKAYHMGGAQYRAAAAAEKLDAAQKTLRLMEKNTRVEQDLQANADTLRRTKNAQIANLTAERDAALDGLRNRPERPQGGDLPKDPGTGPGPSCTGAGLYRPDADFLVREAANAKRVQLDLAQCKAAYDKARQTLMR